MPTRCRGAVDTQCVLHCLSEQCMHSIYMALDVIDVLSSTSCRGRQLAVSSPSVVSPYYLRSIVRSNVLTCDHARCLFIRQSHTGLVDEELETKYEIALFLIGTDDRIRAIHTLGSAHS